MQYSSVASGDISIISLSGFSLTSDTLQPPAPLSKMGEIKVRNG